MSDRKHLHILWTNADLDTFQHMVVLYATNSMLRGWWDDVTVIVWGATASMIAASKEAQQYMETAVRVGVKFSACVTCARALGVEEKLADMGIEVIPWGQPLTELIQGEKPLLSI